MPIEPTNDTNGDSEISSGSLLTSPDTDNLDAFSDLLSDKTKETPATEEVKEEEEEEPSAAEKEETENKEPPVKKKNRVQDRIDELTARAREAERALVALQAAQSNKPNTETPQALPATTTTTPPAFQISPDATNTDGSLKYPLGEFDPGYIRDLALQDIKAEWEQAKQKEAHEAAQRQEQQVRQELNNQWQERLAPAFEQHKDFLEKTLELEESFEGLEPQYSDYLVQTIKSLDHGPDVLYYFANNLNEAKKFVKMGPLQATLALGEINALFKGQPGKTTPTLNKVSKAPPPPQLNKGASARTLVADDTDDLDAFTEKLFRKK
jgi:hypothetical protein